MEVLVWYNSPYVPNEPDVVFPFSSPQLARKFVNDLGDVHANSVNKFRDPFKAGVVTVENV
jgi:hypothetical protein